MLEDSKWEELEEHLDSIFTGDFDVEAVVKVRMDRVNGKISRYYYDDIIESWIVVEQSPKPSIVKRLLNRLRRGKQI